MSRKKAYSQVRWLVEAEYADILVIRTLVVHPSFLKQEVATRLMEFAKQYAVSHRMKSIRLDVSVDNTPAISLYKNSVINILGLLIWDCLMSI